MIRTETAERMPSLLGGSLCEQFALHLGAQGKAGVTVRVYKNAVHLFQAFLADQSLPLDVATIQSEHIAAFIDNVAETRRPGTANSRYWGLRQFFEWQVEGDAIPISPMVDVAQPRKPGKSPRVRTERYCSDMDSVEPLSNHGLVGMNRGVRASRDHWEVM